MKRILFIAPHSFPIKSSESICNSKLAYSLAESGYHVDVIACSDDSTYPTDMEYDSYLRSSSNLHIYQIVPDHILSRGKPLLQTVKDILYNVRILFKSGYFYNGISVPYQIVEFINSHFKPDYISGYDAMITRGFLTDIVGIYYSRKFSIKWIANWNDPFPQKRFPAPYGSGFDAKLPYFEQKVIDDIQKYASIHTFPNPRLRDYMLKCFPLVDAGNTYVMPHMALSTLNQTRVPSHTKLSFLHCGNVRYPRSPKLFLEALSEIYKANVFGGTEVECVFIGGYDRSLPAMVDDLGLSSIVKLLPGKNYKDSMKCVSECSVSLIIEAQCEEGIYLPTKVVDSMQCGTPIFAISPKEGVLNDLTNRYRIGYFADNTDVSAIRNSIRQIYLDFIAGKLPAVTKESAPIFFEDAIVDSYKKII